MKEHINKSNLTSFVLPPEGNGKGLKREMKRIKIQIFISSEELRLRSFLFQVKRNLFPLSYNSLQLKKLRMQTDPCVSIILLFSPCLSQYKIL